jgi:hypothetical protein
MKSEVFCVVALLAMTTCNSRSPIEKGLVGTWTMPTTTVDYHEDGSKTTTVSDSGMEITFTDDHRELWCMRGEAPLVIARWRVEAGDLISIIEKQPKDMNLPKQRREKIVKVSEKEIVFSDGTTEGRWTRVR